MSTTSSWTASAPSRKLQPTTTTRRRLSRRLAQRLAAEAHAEALSVPGGAASLVGLLRWRAQEQPETVAYRFLGEELAVEDSLSHAELDRRARAVAVRLQELGARPGDRVLILQPPGLDYVAAFFGCLYAGAVAVPAYPPDPKRLNKTLPRLQAIVDDCGARLVLAPTRVTALLKAAATVEGCGRVPFLGKALGRLAARAEIPHIRLRGVRTLSVNGVSLRKAEQWTSPGLGSETLAFLQYTSGSTGSPKGVMVTHGNVLHNQAMIQRTGGINEQSVFVGWTPLFHDMGLMVSVVQPLFSGTPSYIMSPLTFLRKPVRWLEAVSRHGATHSGGPNFAFDLCVKRITEEESRGLDLSRWEVAFSSSEPVRAATIDAFCARFAANGFRRENVYPCYGMADTTLLISGSVRGRGPISLDADARALEQGRVSPAAPGEPRRTLVSSGLACQGSQVRVVRPGTGERAGADEIGELWVAGPHVTQGYWGRPEATRAAYGNRLPGEDEAFLRTGDLGFVRDGEVYITGRSKDLIIIRGRNLYAHDVEAVVSAERARVPEIRPGCGTAFGVEGPAGEELVLCQEVDPAKVADFDPARAAAAIRRCVLDEFGVALREVVLLRRGTVPKTSSGKLMRFASRQAYLAGFAGWKQPPLHRDRATDSAPAAPAQEGGSPQAWLVARLAQVLEVAPAELGPTRRLVDLGLDSLSLTALLEAAERELGLRLPVGELLAANPTIAELAARLGRDARRAIPAVAARPSAQPPAPNAQDTSSVHSVAIVPAHSGPRRRVDYTARKRARIHELPEIPADAPAFARVVNPFVASLLADLGLDKRYRRGLGTTLVDAEGREHLDFIAQYGALPFGYNPPRVWRALDELRDAHEPSFAQPSLLDAAGELAERLLRHAPGLAYVTYANSGAEAIEAAIKLCRASTGRLGILSTEQGYHGKTLGALSATGRAEYQRDFGAPAPGFARVPYGDVDAVEAALAEGGFAAMLVEPIQGEAGVVVPPEGYLRAVAQVCRRHDVLLIVDEVQTGLGRTGEMFASVAEGVTPDVLVVAKALGGGLMPVGACLCRAEVYNRDFALKHSSTFAGNALACRAGIATLDLLEEDEQALLGRVRANGAYLRRELELLAATHPRLIREVRGRGLMLGIELSVNAATWPESVPGYLAEQGMFSWLVCGLLLEHERVRLAPTLNGSQVLRVQPALTATRAECQRFVAALARTLERIEGGDSAALLEHLVGVPQGDAVRVPAAPAPTPAPARGTRFAFLVHPLDAGSLAQLDRRLSAFAPAQLEDLQGRMHRQAEPFTVGELALRSPRGAQAVGRFVALPHTAAQLRTMPAQVALEQVEAALELALEDAPQLVGLGGFSSVVTQGGLLLERAGVPALTAGSGLTAIAGEVAAARALARRGRTPGMATVAILGAAGQVGSALSLLMTAHARRLVLVGNPARGALGQERLRRVLLAVVRELAGCRQAAPPGSLRARIVSQLVGESPERVVAELLRSGAVILASALPEQPRADVIFTATSAAGRILDARRVRGPAIVCELSRPFNAAAALRGQRAVELIEGGVVALPGAPPLGFQAGLPPGCAYACMAETMLLALERRFDLARPGHGVSLAALEQLRGMARAHQFQVQG